MSWELDDEERRLALSLSAQERYSYLVQLVVDEEEIWGLRNEEGWVLGSDPKQGDILPVWPHSAFAAACARGTWDDARPAEVPLEELLDELLPLLAEQNITVAAFPLPEGDSLLVSPGKLDRDLRAEIELGQGDAGPQTEDLEDMP